MSLWIKRVLVYTKICDKVEEKTFLGKLDLHGKNLSLLTGLGINSLHTNRKQNEYTKIKKAWQGCVFSSDLFNLYQEMILRECRDLQRFVIGRYNLNNRHYADDTVLMAESES